jgi:beta-phosphoglucomutase
MIKAVVFDMDGVLVEAKEWHYEALNKALSLFGYQISRNDHLTSYDGLPTSRKLEMFALEHRLPKALHPFISEMKQVYTMELVHTRCKPTFAHEYALSKLKADGYLIGLASNSIRNTINVMMETTKLIKYLDIIMSNEDIERPKPDPEIYLKTMVKLNVKPEECLILEDNENGIKAAKASGAYVLQVSAVTDVTYDNIKAQMDRIVKAGQE